MGQYKIKDLDNYIESVAYTFEDAVNAVNEKGGSASTEQGLTSLPDAIRSIPAGGEPTWPSVDNTKWEVGNILIDGESREGYIQFNGNLKTMNFYLYDPETWEPDFQSETPYSQNNDSITAMYGTWHMTMVRTCGECSAMRMLLQEQLDCGIYHTCS